MRGVLVLVIFSAVVGCDQRATSAQCESILDRIVELELIEQGYRDPVLAEQKRVQMRRELASQIRSCTGKAIRPSALACVRTAHSTEEISHRCLH